MVISWTSNESEIGKVKFKARHQSEWKMSSDSRGDSFKDDIHYIELDNLEPGTEYEFAIISGTSEYNVQGHYFTQSTSSVDTWEIASNITNSCMPGGKIYFENGSFAENVIVYVTIIEGQNFSATDSFVVTSENDGFWLMNLLKIRTRDHNDAFPYQCGSSTILIEVQGGNEGKTWMMAPSHPYNVKRQDDLTLKKKQKPDVKGVILILQSLAEQINLSLIRSMNVNGTIVLLDDENIGISDALYMLKYITEN
jgi:hypothetical protein